MGARRAAGGQHAGRTGKPALPAGHPAATGSGTDQRCDGPAAALAGRCRAGGRGHAHGRLARHARAPGRLHCARGLALQGV